MAARGPRGARGRAPPLPIAAEGDEDPLAVAAAAAAAADAAAAAAEDRDIYGPNTNHDDSTEELDEIQMDAVRTKALLSSKRVAKDEFHKYLITPPGLIARRKFRKEVELLFATLPANARSRRHLLSLELAGHLSGDLASNLRSKIDKDMQIIRDCPTELQRLNKGRPLVNVKPYLMRYPALLPKPDIKKKKKKKSD